MTTPKARERERRRQLLIIDRMNTVLERGLRKEISRTMNRAAALASEGESTESATIGHKERVQRILYPFYKRVAEVFTGGMLEQLKSDRGPEVVKKRTQDGLVSEFLQVWVARFGAESVVSISETTKKQIQDATYQIINEGLSQRDAARRIRQLSSIYAPARSQTIARTESHRAAMAATENAARELPADYVKVWVASKGPDTRGAHQRADGQAVELNDRFTVDGEKLRYPGDPSGSAANVINCRCVAVYEPRR